MAKRAPNTKKSTVSKGKPLSKAGKKPVSRAGSAGSKGGKPGSSRPVSSKPGSKPVGKATAGKAKPAKRIGKKLAAVLKAPVRKVRSAPVVGRQGPAEVAKPAHDPSLVSPAASKAPLSDREVKLKLQQETSRKFAVEVARLCKDDKCTDVLLLDVRGLSSVTDYIIIGSGTSDRQMKSVLDHVAELGHKHGFTQSKTNSDDRSTWLLIDFVDVMVHLFEPTTRAHYDIEMLWGDAPRLEWERPDQIDRDRAGLSLSGTRRI